jgi:hypothetical protein
MLVFVTAVKHPDNSQSYEEVWNLLNNTLFSVCSQSDQNFRVIVVCDKKLPLIHHAELINRYTEFVEVDFPSHGNEVINNFNRLGNLSPQIEDRKWWKQWSRDTRKISNLKIIKLWRKFRELTFGNTKRKQAPKYMSKSEIKLMSNYAINRGSKQLVGILAAKKFNPDYVLIFDADDYVHSEIAAYVNAHLGENGWIMANGYKMMNNLIAPFNSKNSFCGTGNIISYSLLLENIPPGIDEKSAQNELFKSVDSEFILTLARHGKVRAYYRKKDRLMLDYPLRGAVHLLGHQESNDYQRRIIRGEPSSNRLKTAQYYSKFSPVSPRLVNQFNILPKDTTKVFCVGINETGIKSLQVVLEDMEYQVARHYKLANIEFWKKLEKGDFSDIKHFSEMFNAFQDAPWFLFYKEFDNWYPGSKFILTIRDSRSWLKNFLKYSGKVSKPLFKYFYGFENPIGHEKIFVERFEEHNREVIEYFKDRPKDLLVIDVREDNVINKISTFLRKRTSFKTMPPDKIIYRAPIINGNTSSERIPTQKTNKQLIRTINGNREGIIQYSTVLSPASLRYQHIGGYLANTSHYPSNIQYQLTISQEKKFVWFRVAKVGTRTILDILNQANVDLVAEHALDCYYPVNMYKEYFRFAFIRNPWDRIVSCWRDKIIGKDTLKYNNDKEDFENFVDYVAKNIDLDYGNSHLRLQSRLIDLNHIDYLGRFETFQKDIIEVMNILGIKALIKKKNASNRIEDYREYYSNSTKDKVAKLYKKDIKIFNYEF